MIRFLLTGLFLLGFLAISRAEDDTQARAIFDQLLKSVDTKDYNAFVSNADDAVRGAITKTQFEAVSNMMTAHGQHDVSFLGELNQRGFEVYLYRLRYPDGDVLATMSLKDGKIAGIFFK